jgi:hypothetical protein
MANIKISVEAVRFEEGSGTGFSSTHWEPFAYLNDSSVRTSRTIDTSSVDVIYDDAAHMADEFGFACKVFVTVLSGRTPNGFKTMKWPVRKSAPTHPHYNV